MTVDFIILGRGICGTLLGWHLLQQGSTVLIIADSCRQASTTVASGLINPVTGKRLVQSWMYDRLLPEALHTYRQIEAQTGRTLIQETSLLQFHQTEEAANLFNQRKGEDDTYLHDGNERVWEPYFETRYGIGAIDPCWLVDSDALLKNTLPTDSPSISFIDETFDWQECQISPNEVRYKHITASKIICCDGAAGATNPYFSLLPFSLNKGEAVIARIPNLPPTHIYQRDLKIVPLKDDLFWIGSSFDWKYNDLQPTDAFRKKVEASLKHWLKLPYKIIDHWAAERPSPVDYRPFIGLHPYHPAIGILNGMGTKGFLQAPYFARCLAEHLISGKSLPPYADISRFQRVLGRG